MVSYVAHKKLRIAPAQRCTRVDWCYEHLSWSVNDWPNVVFTDESNYEILNRKNRMHIYVVFDMSATRFERSQQRVGRGGGGLVMSYTNSSI